MRCQTVLCSTLLFGFMLGGCPDDSTKSDPSQDGDGGSTHAGTGAGSGGGSGTGGSGGTVAGSGAKDAGASTTQDAGLVGTGCKRGGCSGELCLDASAEDVASDCIFRPQYACYQKAACESRADGACAFTQSEALADCLEAAADGGSSLGLTWQETCGAPLCHDPAVDDPAVANCDSAQIAGASCGMRDEKCDLVNGCGTKLVCTDTDPTNGGQCPKSRARYKRDINYLSRAERERVYRDLLAIPLASYEYKSDPQGNPQLGFILEDVEPSPATRGDHVNLYGYLTMAVNAVQLQAKQIDALESEVAKLRAQTEASRASCEP